MTSSVTQYSSLIDTTFPIPGADNDTQGFRNNYIQISKAFNTVSSEITNLQLQQSKFLAQLNNSTVVGTNYIANIVSTVTSVLMNSLTNVSYYTTSTPLSSHGRVGDSPGLISANTSYVYVCYTQYSTGNNDIWARIATTSSTWTS